MTASSGDTTMTLRLVPTAAPGSRSKALRDRAEGLRDEADALPSALATAYRRRAAELELEAWLTEWVGGAAA